MIFGCPGAQRFKQPHPEIIKCQFCNEELEIWTDEAKTICIKCANTVTRNYISSCLDWCKYAKACIGEQDYSNYLKSKGLSV